ncbi:hypothetical protein ACHBTE_15200 [Streptomyces sp. M41]|uniref:hypothetical protein n=1 Tax=Streptomyces sp. M41 TaxID=3059412 RepID=UPI00374DCEB8
MYEIEPTGNVISFAKEARNEHQARMTEATAEWVAVRKINAENIIRATKYKREFPADKNGLITSLDAPFKKVDTWENPQYTKGARGYDPYEDPSSGWSDAVTLFTATDNRADRGMAETEAREHAVPRVCDGAGNRSKRSTSTDSGCGIVEWDKVRERAKQTVTDVLTDAEHTKSLPQRNSEGLGQEELTRVVEQTKAKITARNGAHISAGAAGVALWAAGMAQTFSDQNATTLDKVSVTMSVVPGIGQALGIADGVQHRDAETIAVNAISLAALVAAQAIPVVGELVDTAILVEQLVEAISGLFPHFRTGPPAHLPAGAVADMPTLKTQTNCTTWKTLMDITWETPDAQLPAETRVVVRSRDGEERTYPVLDRRSPDWQRPEGGHGDTRTFDVFLRLKRDWGIYQSERRSVVETTSKFLECATSTREESWS